MLSDLNAMILKTINTMTAGKEVVISSIDSLKDVFNVSLEPAIALSAVVITNQSGFNYLDKLKDSDGKYILQPNPTQPTQMLLCRTRLSRARSLRTHRKK